MTLKAKANITKQDIVEEINNRMSDEKNKKLKEKDKGDKGEKKKEEKGLTTYKKSPGQEQLSRQNSDSTLLTKKEEQVFIIGKVRKTYLKESDVLRALELNAGLVSETAKMLRTSYPRLKEFIESNTALKAAADEILEVRKDLAESELSKHIRNGNLTAIIFFLKTRAKDRGYVESMDVVLPNKPIYFVYKEVNPIDVKK